MKRTLSSWIAAVLVATATPAFADPDAPRHAPEPENTAAACRDGVDNDQDGYIDCRDQDCFDFVFCQSQAVPPAAVPPPAAPPVVAPPAPVYPPSPAVIPPAPPPPPAPSLVEPAPTPAPYIAPAPLPSLAVTATPVTPIAPRPGNGKKMLIAGAVLTPIGIALAAASAPLWFDGLDVDHTGLNHFQSFHDGVMLGVGSGMTVLGVGLFATGISLIGVGAGHLIAERRGGAR